MDRGVIATAEELYRGRHYPGVVAVCSDALDDEPECQALLMTRARAYIALRRELEAQADLRDLIRLDPHNSLAYRLLGELAARRAENESAAIFFTEALRLDPDDREAQEWLAIVGQPVRPVAATTKLPAPVAAAGRFAPEARPLARGTSPPPNLSANVTLARGSVEDAWRPPAPHFRPPTAELVDEETADELWRRELDCEETLDRQAAPVRELVVQDTASHPWRTRAPARPVTAELRHEPQQPRREMTAELGKSWRAAVRVAPPAVEETSELAPPPAPLAAGSGSLRRPTTADLDEPELVAAPIAPRRSPPPVAGRGPVPELPGFAEYLVSSGILTRERLRAAQAYQRSMNVQLSTAVVTLGLATAQRIEWAAVAHQSTLARNH